MAKSAISRHPSRLILACAVMKEELEHVRGGEEGVEIRYMDQGLHRTTGKMAGMLQGVIDQLPEGVEKVVLGYGLCGNGILGVTARNHVLIVPRCHDCIALFWVRTRRTRG